MTLAEIDDILSAEKSERRDFFIMGKLIKKIVAAGIAAALTATAAISVSAVKIQNEKIILRTNSGSYDMFSTEGGNLLFSFSSRTSANADATSRAYISVNGSCNELYFYNDVADPENLNISGTTKKSDISVQRDITLISNSVSGAKDTAEFKLTMTNTSDQTKSVGGKFFLDTMVEGNDYAPFRVAGVGAISKKTQLEGDAIPASFQAFDSLDDPKTIGTGTFATGAGKPDVVQFRNYSDIRYPLVPDIDTTDSIGDSAVNVIWLERELAPGETVIFRTYYGLGSIDVSEGSDLMLGATKIDGNFTVNEAGTGYEPVRLTSYVTNTGIVALSEVEMSLTLPAGVTADQTAYTVGDLAIRAEKQNTWTLTATPSPVERTVTVTVNAKSKETGEVTPVSYTYTIPAIEGAEPIVETTAAPTTEPVTEEPTTVEATAAPTTAAPTTVQPTTAATKDEATKSEATKSEASNGTVKTGEAVPAVAVLLTLVAGVGVIYFYRRKYSK